MQKKTILYIAFLRGINVGGHIVKMELLRGLFVDLRLSQVRSYIQSGNVFFESEETDKEKLRTKIESSLESQLGFHVAVCLRTVEELEKVLSKNPFESIALTPEKRFAVTFFATPVTQHLSLPYTTPDGGYEVVAMTSTELFVVWHLKDGRPSSSYGLIDKQIKVETTTRFWHTLAKILVAAKQG